MMNMLNKILASFLSMVFLFAVALPNHIAEQQPGQYEAWPTQEFRTPSLPGWLGTGLAMEAVYGLIGLMHGGPVTAGLLVVHRGNIVYERYARGQDKDTPHEMYSVTKSVVSALVGIAIGEGKIKGVDQKVIDFFPDAVIAAGQECKRDMTIRHLLTMTSGLPGDGDDNDWNWWDAKDSGKAAFETPQYTKPGERFNYNSGPAMQTLACLVSRAVKQNLFEYAKKKLFGPLGMASATWDAAADGNNYGGFGLSMTARDMARFGYLYLRGGRWEDSLSPDRLLQIIPADYIAATSPPSEQHNEYGYLFWTFNKYSNFEGTYEANGSFGQYIDIFPAWDTVIVRTGDMGWLFETAATIGVKYLGFASLLPNGVPLEAILGPLGKLDVLP